jgi:hypothetical protein
VQSAAVTATDVLEHLTKAEVLHTGHIVTQNLTFAAREGG